MDILQNDRFHYVLKLATCYLVGLLMATLALGAEPSPALLTDASASRYTAKVMSGQNTYVGHPIVHNQRQTVLLRRNGRIKLFDSHEVDKIERVSSSFRPKTGRQLRVELQKEFGSKYEVSLTRHYVVVHPPGAYQRWALPFEQFYVRFRQWFSSRGLHLKQAEFPMVAIVLLNRHEYDRFTSRYTSFSYATDGYFNSSSNRMITYDKSGGRKNAGADVSFDTMTTVIHEAVHQAGHNVGIHSRFFPQPQWFKEGLATFFEAPGVNHPAANPRDSHRINKESALDAQRFFDRHEKMEVVEFLVRSDSLFKADTRSAYGVSWALTSYLFEKFPHQYVKYIKLQNLAPDSSGGSADARLKTFEKAFGPPNRIEGGLRSYVASLDK